MPIASIIPMAGCTAGEVPCSAVGDADHALHRGSGGDPAVYADGKKCRGAAGGGSNARMMNFGRSRAQLTRPCRQAIDFHAM